VLVNSQYTGQLVARLGLASTRLALLYPAVELGAPASGDQLAALCARHGLADRLVVLTVGRLVPRKGHADLLRAIACLKPRFPSLLYLIAGEGPAAASLRQLSQALGIDQQVRLIGRVSPAELDALYRACTIFALPARQVGHDVEGFGIALVEAALRARPSLAARSGGVAEVVQHGQTGFLVQPGDHRALAERLAQLLQQPQLRDRLGQQAAAWAGRTFSQAAQLRRLAAVLETC
jgi:phosphatidylinositol alpha-1,6-mannosyltransferase